MDNDGTKSFIRKVSSNARLYGLWLEINAGPNSTETYFDDRSGFVIHNQSIIPFSKGNTLTASANMHTEIKIK
jgi:hypothetical protein